MSTIISTMCGGIVSGIYLFWKKKKSKTAEAENLLPNKLLQVFLLISVKSTSPYLLKLVVLMAIK